MPFLTRTLSPQSYGIVSLFTTILSLFGVLIGLSVHGAVGVRLFETTKEKLAEYVFACFCLITFAAALLMFFLLAFDNYFQRLTTIPLWLLIAAVFAAFLQTIIQVRLVIWQMASNACKFVIFQTGRCFFEAAFSVFFVSFCGLNWSGRVIGIVLPTLLFGAFSLVSLIQDRLIAFNIQWNVDAKAASKFGLPLLPHALAGLLICYGDRFVVAKVLGEDMTGIYTSAWQVSSLINLLTISMNQAFAPWLLSALKSNDESIKRKIVIKTYLFFALLLCSGILFGMMGQEIFPYFVGKKFQEASFLVLPLSLGFAFHGCYLAVTNYVFYAKKTLLLGASSFLICIIYFISSFFFTLRLGLTGTAIAFLLSYFLLFLSTWVLAAKAFKMPWFKMIYARNTRDENISHRG